MSDPMTNTEVEDVLSSIRRLVSDESRSEPATREPLKPVSDRLVLTPSLRVPEDDVPEDVVPEDVVPEGDVSEGDAADENLAEATQWEAETPSTSEQTGSEQDHFDFKSARSIFDIATSDDDPALFQDNSGAAVETSDDAEVEEQASGVAQEDVADIAPETGLETTDHVEEVSEADEYVAEDPENPEALEGADYVEESLGNSAPIEDDLEEAQHVDAVSEAEAHSPVTLGEKIAALETLIAGRADEWEPDQAGASAYAGTEPPAMTWEDAGDLDADDQDQDQDETAYDVSKPVNFSTHAETDLDTPESELSNISSEENVLDEDVLRELVSDIVREELQGALGERITRNVRKLVRREIHRALVAQELE